MRIRKLGGLGGELYDGVRATLPGWVVAHALVFAVCFQIGGSHPVGPLEVWDTHWYFREADGLTHGGSVFGDGAGPGDLTHFFPLTPLAAAGLALVSRVPVMVALFGVNWVCALLFGAAVYMVAVREGVGVAGARRAALLAQLAPGAFVLTLGYTEPLADLLAVLYFLAVRRERTRWALAFGLLAGLSRPTGLVLALPGAIEAVRACARGEWRASYVARGLVRAAAPVLGLGLYLGYCQVRFHDWVLPYAQQEAGANRGGVAQDPIHTIAVVAGYGAVGILVTSLACAAIGVGALVVCRRVLPSSYTAWSAVMFVLAVTSPWFTSEPRYLAAIFPLLIALPAVLRKRWSWYGFLAVDLALLYWVTWLALGMRQVA